jgi:RimJ/RimL family protein N-acetyltransferase
LKLIEHREITKDISTDFPLINAVLKGLQDGSIYCEENDEQTIFIIHKAGFSKLMADDNYECSLLLNWALRDDKIPKYFHVYDASRSLIASCEKRKNEVNFRVRKRIKLNYDEGDIIQFKIGLPLNYAIQRIDFSNIGQLSAFNLSIGSKFWGSEENFISDGFGFCVVNEANLPVSICYSACIANHVAEIDVATLQKYQHLGLAKNVVIHFVKHCVENGIIPNWDCFEDNQSSLKTAKRVGFKPVFSYDLLSIFNKTRDL